METLTLFLEGTRSQIQGTPRLRQDLFPRSAEKKDMTVWIGYLKAAQSIVRILERLAKSRAAAGELDGKFIGIRYIAIRIPPGPGIALRIGKWIATPL